MDLYDPQTIGIVIFSGFMAISAVVIILVSTFSMKETSYEEALAKQRQELSKIQPQQRTEKKKKKDKSAEKKNREKKKKEEKPTLKLQESETTIDPSKATPDDQAISPELQTQEPESAPAAKSAPVPVNKPATAISLKSTEPSGSKATSNSSSKPTTTPVPKTVQASAAKPPVFAHTTSAQPQVSAPAEAPPCSLLKDRKKREKKGANVEPASTQAAPVSMLVTMVKEVSVKAVPTLESQKSSPLVETKQAVPSKKKAGPKKNADSGATVDAVDAPVQLPYKTLLSTLKSKVLSEGEAQQLIEILSEKAGLQDTWHMVTQKGDPVAVLKKQLEEKERQVSTALEDATAAKNRLKELSKELSAEKSKVASVETRLSSQLSKREQEMIALQARMQASYQDQLAETQQLNAKVGSLQEQLEKGPNAQLARLQQENSILRDALNKATSQADSKQNAELAKLRQDCARLNRELGEKTEALHSEEQLRKNLETKASVAEKQLCQLQTSKLSSEQALQRRLEEVSEELRKAQSSNSSLHTQLGQAQRDTVALTEARGCVAVVEAEMREKVGQVEDLRLQLSQSELVNRQLQEQLVSVHTLLEASQSEQLKQNTDAMVSELEEAKNSLKEKDSRVTLLEEELTQLRAAVTKLERGVRETESVSNSENERQVASLQEELRSLTDEMERLKTQAGNRAAEVEHLQNSLKEKDNQIALLQVDLKEFKEHLDNSKHDSTRKLEQMQDCLSEREARLYSLEEELKQHEERSTSQVNATAQLDSLQSSLIEKEKFVTALQQKLQQLTEEADQAKHTNEDGTEDLRVFQTESISVLQTLFPHISINTKQDKWLQEFSKKAQETLIAKEQCLQSHQSKVTELLGRLSEVQESQSTLQADCEQYRSVLAETEGMLKTLQRSVEEEETGWRARVAELEEQLRRTSQKAQMLEETTENLRSENQNTEQLKQLLAESERQLQVAQSEVLSHREELIQVRKQLSQLMECAASTVENGQPEPQSCQVQAELEQSIEKLQTEQALKQQLSEEVEQAHRAVAELQMHLDQLRASGENPADTENVSELKERLEKERKLTKDLGHAATKLQQLLRSSQDQLAKEKETVRILQNKLQEKEEGMELKEGTSV